MEKKKEWKKIEKMLETPVSSARGSFKAVLSFIITVYSLRIIVLSSLYLSG